MISVTAGQVEDAPPWAKAQELVDPLIDVEIGEQLVRPDASLKPILLLAVAQIRHAYTLRRGTGDRLSVHLMHEHEGLGQFQAGLRAPELSQRMDVLGATRM